MAKPVQLAVYVQRSTLAARRVVEVEHPDPGLPGCLENWRDGLEFDPVVVPQGLEIAVAVHQR